MSKTLSQTYQTGVTLTLAADNPTTITADGRLYGGLNVDYAGAWQILNQGWVEGPAYGINLSGGGTVTNEGLIAGVEAIYGASGGALTVVNDGGITGSSADGVNLQDGGSVTNQAAGLISGYVGVYATGGSTLTVINDGSILATGPSGAGVALKAGGSVANQGDGTIAGAEGISGGSVAVTVVNGGSIAGTDLTGSAIDLFGGGSITNQATGSITGATAIYAYADLTVVNYGNIAAFPGDGIALMGGGSVTNQQGGAIYGYDAIYGRNAAVSVINDGSITAGGTGIRLIAGGDVTNQSGGTISGAGGIAGVAAMTVVNAGSILASGPTGSAIYLFGGGSVTNQSGGTIYGDRGVYGGNAGALTVVNAAAITGLLAAVQFVAGYDDRLIVDPGAVFYGTVDGGNGIGATAASTLELASGTGVGTLSGLGSQFVDFAQVVVDAGAQWTLDTTDTVASGVTLENAGTLYGAVTLAPGGTLANSLTGTVLVAAGPAVYGQGYGTATVVNYGTIITTDTVSGRGVYLAGGGLVLNQSGATIAGDYGITGGNGSGDALTVVNDGSVIGGDGAGIYLMAGGSVTNQGDGTITGYSGIVSYYGTSVTVLNAGTIAGYITGIALLSGGSVTNQGTGLISGGNNGILGAPYGTMSVVNGGTILAQNGIGVALFDGGSVTNQSGGIISGYVGIVSGTLAATVVNAGGISGSLGDGIDLLAGGSVTNQGGGTISGYVGIYGGDTASVVDAGSIAGDMTGRYAAGVALASFGSVTNQSTASITGDVGIYGRSAAVTVVNAGTITGSYGGVILLAGGSVSNQTDGTISAYLAVYGRDAPLTVVNDGTIAGTYGGAILHAGGSVSNQSGGTISAYVAVYGYGAPLIVVNDGSIEGGTAGTDAAGVVILSGGTVINDATASISGYDGIYGGTAGRPASSAMTVVNAGTIAATGSLGAGVALEMGGSVTNQSGGIISGYAGITTAGYAATVENAGTIAGTIAVRFAAGYANLLVVDPNAVFSGGVDGGNPIGGLYASTLELAAGPGPGTLSGIGIQFVDFSQTTIDAGASWVLAGDNTLTAGTTLSNAGTLILTDATLFDAGLVVNDGVVEIDPSNVTLTDLTGIGSVAIDAGSTLEIQGTVSTGETIAFAGGNAALAIDPDEFAGQINGFTAGDTIDLTGVTDGVSAGIVNGNTLEIVRSGGGLPIDLTLDPTQDYAANHYAVSPDGAVTQEAPCFLRDTLIRTERGEVMVQHLTIGDRVLTLSGQLRRITWIGTGEVLVRPFRRCAATPVIVRKGALADGVPYHDLRITKGHSLFIDDVLVPVEFLINHHSIQWDDHGKQVTFYHIELATHDVVIANGAAAESYRDDGNRWLFRNANTGWDQPSRPPCAPVLTDGPVVDAIWRRLLDRVRLPAATTLTENPDLHLLVDGVRVDATTRRGTAHGFRLPARRHEVRIVSRAAAPAELGIGRDPRRLGVAITQVMVSKGKRLRVMDATDPDLADGFHPDEPALGLRWTDGDAGIPASLLAGFDGVVDLVLLLGGSTRYPGFGQPDPCVAA